MMGGRLAGKGGQRLKWRVKGGMDSNGWRVDRERLNIDRKGWKMVDLNSDGWKIDRKWWKKVEIESESWKGQ